MQATLASKMRPSSLNEILGQKHLIGEHKILTQIVLKKHPLSMILYGPPGCGKTTLAMALANDLGLPYRIFNASTGNKKEMDTIIEEAKIYDGLFVIVDEVHRLNKDKQDHLLPYLENGLLIMVGCTTANPYHAINPAIRSRCQILKVHPLECQDILIGLKSALKKQFESSWTYDEEALMKIAQLSAGDIRYAYQCLEATTLISEDTHIDLNDVENAGFKVHYPYDKDEDQYYDTLSGLQKSIRGSDVDGALYYLAKLIEAEDLLAIERRLLTIAYEDIGLANPEVASRTILAIESAKRIGFPEAKMPLSVAVIDLALAHKSQSAYQALERARRLLNTRPYRTPSYLSLTPVGLEKEDLYDYDRPELWEYIQYLPEEIAQEQFYVPWLTSPYERTLKEQYERIRKHGRTPHLRRLKEMNTKK